MSSAALQVLIVDDTVVYRKILSDVVAACPDTEVAATAPHGRLALSKLQAMPVDVVLLDVEMPDMGGLETLDAIKRTWPQVAVIMVSGANAHSKETTVRALEAGALDFLMKPDGDDVESNRQALLVKLRPLFRHVLTQRNLKAVTQAPTARPATPAPAPPPPRPVAPPAPAPPRLATPSQPIDLVVVGVSTGGPNALLEFIPSLPQELGVPVLLVQHMPPGFTASLASHLDQRSRVRVKEGEEGETLANGTVYIAPGGRHMVIRRFSPAEGGPPRLVVGLNDNPPEHSCRPSVDVLFRSAASHLDGRVLAVVMTGMGCDGLEGVRTLKRKGARCLTQSEASCVVYGMPMAVDEAGLSDESVNLQLLGRRVTELVRGTGR